MDESNYMTIHSGQYVIFSEDEHGQYEIDRLLMNRGQNWKNRVFSVYQLETSSNIGTVYDQPQAMVGPGPVSIHDYSWVEVRSLRPASPEEILIFEILSR